jgi:cytochrome P450
MFARLRNEDPVHYTAESDWGAYWSITRFDDIIEIDKDHENFSSETGGIVIGDPDEDFNIPNFIAMDPPKHDEQRKTVTGIVAPRNLAQMEELIRGRVQTILDSLPVGEEFNWVDLVSIELTTQMLATLFDFPFEDRNKLPFWSDMATATPQVGDTNVSKEEREAALMECLEYFTRLFNERGAKEPGETLDLITMMAHGESTKNMEPMEFLGNLVLLIVGGNDTTRNSISGGVLALNENPAEYQKLSDNPALIPSMVSEIIRWQTPLAHMRRTAVRDVEFGGKKIKEGDRVVMWYVSGNRDADAIDNPDDFIIDRKTPRHHLSFGFGIHRCMGNRLAEMQLRILWEEILQRFERVELVGEAIRTQSNFVRGYTHLPVVLHPKK